MKNLWNSMPNIYNLFRRDIQTLKLCKMKFLREFLFSSEPLDYLIYKIFSIIIYLFINRISKRIIHQSFDFF